MNLQEINSIVSKINNKVFSPVYFLMGEEAYYIDLINDLLLNKVLNEDEKSFNQTILYGKDTNTDEIISVCKRFPMMSKFQLVIIKEAQDLSSKIDGLLNYMLNPMHSTILVINYKYKSLDKRKKIYKAIQKFGLILNSKKPYDNQVSTWITNKLKENNYTIDIKANQMLVEFLGNDLKMINNQLNKLKLLNPKNNNITPRLIEKNIGISKDFNIFELRNAIGLGNISKALIIGDYFSNNVKSYPTQVVLSSLFNYFIQLFQFHSLNNKSENNVASTLGINKFFVKDYHRASKIYPMKKISSIITLIKNIDLKSKGFGVSNNSQENILNQLIVQIMN
ncbi:DNA polymerase III subunit delta [Flavobacteriaceae bacterium]|jgi:DNA polymerase-3 subunit delta|nr:DNA polymerase III subunit delta [Flavobacteriaceae bacterium]MDB0042605.1 DNA polymerase III subunit delta [Flavobacteriaceae bacterium]|tara:strand:+ start:15974 stop:16984 length:1011 start_codon:yes stop_codon:yes gene_type:complete